MAAKRKTDEELNRMLVENFIGLQKAMTNLAVRFDNLSDNLSKLLNLFEISAKSFAEKQPVKEEEKDKEFLGKINTLLEQNKTIAKGLTLMEEKLRERVYGQRPEGEMPLMPQPRLMPEMQDMQPSMRFKKLPLS